MAHEGLECIRRAKHLRGPRLAWRMPHRPAHEWTLELVKPKRGASARIDVLMTSL